MPSAVQRRDEPSLWWCWISLSAVHCAVRKHVAAYLMLVLGGNASPAAADIKNVLDAAGIASDDSDIERLLAAVDGKVRGMPCRGSLVLGGSMHAFAVPPCVLVPSHMCTRAHAPRWLAFGGGGGRQWTVDGVWMCWCRLWFHCALPTCRTWTPCWPLAGQSW